jgi:regulator of replication initiation timing
MVEKEEALEELLHLEVALADTYAVVGKVREALASALSEKRQLYLENERLRARVIELDELLSGKSEEKPAQSLLEAYNEGFHICHAYYGRKLDDGENCLLCQEVLYR